MSPADFVADNLSGAARLEFVDAGGVVVHVVGGPPPAPDWINRARRIHLFDDAGALLADLPFLSHARILQ